MNGRDAALVAVLGLCVAGLVAVVAYDDATVREVRVENAGDERQTATVTVTHDGETLTDRAVTLDPGESAVVSEVRRLPAENDTFVVRVSVDGVTARGTFDVRACDGALVTVGEEPRVEAVGC